MGVPSVSLLLWVQMKAAASGQLNASVLWKIPAICRCVVSFIHSFIQKIKMVWTDWQGALEAMTVPLPWCPVLTLGPSLADCEIRPKFLLHWSLLCSFLVLSQLLLFSLILSPACAGLGTVCFSLPCSREAQRGFPVHLFSVLGSHQLPPGWLGSWTVVGFRTEREK